MRALFYLYAILISTTLFPQKKDAIKRDDYILIRQGDTLNINLKEIALLPDHKFKYPKDVRYYSWFRLKVFKAYPYAILASKRLDTLKDRLYRIKSKRKQRVYTKRAQKYLENEFTEQLKKMTRTEGRILTKLIYRQTGKTVFQNIKELRSGWKAFWYNVTANLFKLSLKQKYDPESVNEDYLIEDILQRAFIVNKLTEQTSKLKMNFDSIVANKKGKIDIEKYKKMFAKARKRKKVRQKK